MDHYIAPASELLYVVWTLYWLVRISVHDVREQIIPDSYLLYLLLGKVFLLLERAALRLPAFSLSELAPAFTGILILWSVYLITVFICSACALDLPMGMGDIKYYSVIALMEGAGALIRVILLSAAFAGAVCAALLILKIKKGKDRIAYGPFISFAFGLYLICGLPALFG